MNGSLGMAGGRCSLLVPVVVVVVSVAAVIIFIVASPLLSTLLNRS